MTDRLDAIREKRQRAYPANTLSHDEADWLIEQVASLRARVETAEQEQKNLEPLIAGVPVSALLATLKVECEKQHARAEALSAQLSEARTKQAEAEERAIAAEQQAFMLATRIEQERKDHAEERTRREQAERERDEAQLLARHGAQECVSATELLSAAIAERDTLQLDLAALRQQIADGR